jgi:general secretion pathway protein I
MRQAQRTTGFTLMEVLVALALLGIAVTVILELFSADLRSISASESYMAGSMEAQSKMREILSDNDFSQRSWKGMTQNGYPFEAAVSDTLSERTENLQVKMVEVAVTVFWKDGAKERSMTLKTMKVIEKAV